MRIIIKSTKSNKGFTLLETMLSTCIMVIISSMLLNGFIATMGFAYHNAVYSQFAEDNVNQCMMGLSTYHDADQDVRFSTIADSEDTATIKFVGGGITGVSLHNLTISSLNYQNLSMSPHGLSGNSPFTKLSLNGVNMDVNYRYDGSLDLDGTLSDNRTVIFYYPTVNQIPGRPETKGKLHIYYVNVEDAEDAETKYYHKYVWAYKEDDGSMTILGVVS